MIGTLKERDLKKYPSTQSLPVIDGTDWHANRYLDEKNTSEYAEAADSIRLFQLLHRDEYKPVAVVRDRTGGSETIRVYFRQLHETDLFSVNDSGSNQLNPSSGTPPH